MAEWEELCLYADLLMHGVRAVCLLAHDGRGRRPGWRARRGDQGHVSVGVRDPRVAPRARGLQMTISFPLWILDALRL